MEAFDCESLNNLLNPYNIYRVDRQGNLDVVKLSFDFKIVALSIEKYNSSRSVSKITRIKNTIQQETSFTKNIPASQIQEIRLSEYDPKTNKINPDELKALKVTRTGSFRRPHFQFKELKVFFGKEFNLKCWHFVVTYKEKVNNEHQNGSQKQESHLESWILRILECLTNEQKYVSYFEKLNRWFINEYVTPELTIVSQQRREIWHQFLERNHHGLSVDLIQENLRFLDSILREHLEYSEYKRFEINEFLLVAKYFVHNNECVTRILEDFKSSLSGKNNKDFIETLNILQTYLSYMSKHKNDLMLISYANIETLPNQRTLTIKEVVGKIDSLKLPSQLVEEKLVSSYYMLDYLYSSNNSIWSPEKLNKYQDMTQPISHYFIASSHNTYLTGNQLNSKSSCEAYARVLRQGCRCIEIDVWDGPGNKPIVKHGNTLTTAIKLKDVLTTIKEHAFISSKYPVIISIENHCSIQQQKTMAKYIRKVFGEMLYKTSKLNHMTGLPSPEQLKNKILLKGATLPKCKGMTSEKVNDCSELQNLNSKSGYINIRNSGHTNPNNGSAFVEPNVSEYLLVGELYMEKHDQTWEPQIFLLSSKTMICIEEESFKSRINKRSQLPMFPVPRSMSLKDLLQIFHENEDWFHGRVPGEYNEIDELLRKSSVEGSFIVWERTTAPGNFVLSIFYQNTDPEEEYADVHHMPIQICSLDYGKSEYKYCLYHYGVKYNSIYDLVSFYLTNSLFAENFTLKHLGPSVQACLPKTHEKMEWFHKDMDHDTSENVLSKLFINGLFLGRYKDETCSEVVISFRYWNQVKHCCIKRQGGVFTVSNVSFKTLEGLIQYYGKNLFYKNVKLSLPLFKHLYEMAISNEIAEESLHMSREHMESNTKTDISEATSQPLENNNSKAVRPKDCPRILERFQPSLADELNELDCPFPNYVGVFKWELGIKTTVKPCINKSALKNGITHYIVFEDENGSTRKLGTTCPIVAKEWMEMIDVVLENNQKTKKKRDHTKTEEDHKVAAELSDLIMLLKMKANITADNFNKILEDTRNNIDDSNKCETFVKSFSELIAESTFTTYSKLWPLYHQHFLTRIYPKALRWNSSNFNPVPFWIFGSQLVALNYQTPDKGMQINRGFFKQNGKTGYVLKPQYLLDEPFPQEEFLYDPIDISQVKSKNILTIEIIGARHLEKSTPGQISPVVEIEIVGVDADNSKVKTSRQETGLNPCWNESFEFHIHYSELALIQFRVYDEDTFHDRLLLGEATIPVSCIRQGFRCVELNNEYGYQLFSRLLVKLKIVEHASIALFTHDNNVLFNSNHGVGEAKC